MRRDRLLRLARDENRRAGRGRVIGSRSGQNLRKTPVLLAKLPAERVPPGQKMVGSTRNGWQYGAPASASAVPVTPTTDVNPMSLRLLSRCQYPPSWTPANASRRVRPPAARPPRRAPASLASPGVPAQAPRPPPTPPRTRCRPAARSESSKRPPTMPVRRGRPTARLALARPAAALAGPLHAVQRPRLPHQRGPTQVDLTGVGRDNRPPEQDPVQTVHADFPTRLSRWTSGRSIHRPRIPNRAAQAYEPQGLEERTTPDLRPPGRQTRPRPSGEQAAHAFRHVPVELLEVVRRTRGLRREMSGSALGL